MISNRLKSLACLGLLALLPQVQALAQVAVPVNSATDPADDPFLRELIRRSRGDNAMLATSIGDALRLKLDGLANGFLASMAKRKIADAELAQLAQRIGTDQLLRVSLQDQFAAEAKTQANVLVDALRRVNQDPKRIASLIPKLLSANVDERLGAIRGVLAGGSESISPLSVAAAKATAAAERDELLRVLLRLGDGGPAAIKQLAIYGDDSLRGGALQSLVRLGEKSARPVLVAAAFDKLATANERQFANQWLAEHYSPPPTSSDAEAYLRDRLATKRRDAKLITDPDTATELWTIADDGSSVMHTTVSTINAVGRGIIDEARLLRRLGELSNEGRNAGLAAELAYRYLLDPLAVNDSKAEVESLWGRDAISGQSLGRLVNEALANDDLVVAVAAMQMIDDTLSSDAESLMTTHSEVPTPLVVAASHSQPRIRYEAAAAISRLGFNQPYAGSSTVLQRWIEMTALFRESSALLVETRIEVAGQIERLLTSMGYRVEVVSTVEQAIMAIDRGGDLRFVITNSVLPDRPVMELLDGIRRRPLGGEVPLIIHGPRDRVVEAAVGDVRWLAPTLHVGQPATVAGWSLILDPLEQRRLLPSLSAVERYDFRQAGAQALGRIASNPDDYDFYAFDKLAGMASINALAGGDSSSVAFGEPVLAVLSVAASRDAQSTLADLAMSSGSTADRRDAAAEALVQSIQRNGVQLCGADLLRIDRMRRSLDNQTAAAIDQVLVVIQGRADVGGIATETNPIREPAKPNP